MDFIFCQYYNSRVCNFYLNLRNIQFTDKQWEEIVYCLYNQDKIHYSVRVKYVNLTKASKSITDLPPELLSKFTFIED